MRILGEGNHVVDVVGDYEIWIWDMISNQTINSRSWNNVTTCFLPRPNINKFDSKRLWSTTTKCRCCYSKYNGTAFVGYDHINWTVIVGQWLVGRTNAWKGGRAQCTVAANHHVLLISHLQGWQSSYPWYSRYSPCMGKMVHWHFKWRITDLISFAPQKMLELSWNVSDKCNIPLHHVITSGVACT